jgi:MFS family permease
MPTNTERRPQLLRDKILALAGLSAVFLFEMLDNSILNVALPTIGRELRASTTALQWITSAYAVAFGSLMLAFGALADRFGRRRIMLTGLVLLAVASFMTVFVKTAVELIGVRALIGVAAAMTTPGTIALSFRLFDDDKLRIRAISAITSVGLVGLAAGPIVGGFLLSILPWQALLLINVPVAVLAFIGISSGVQKEKKHELHPAPVDVKGTLLLLMVIASILTTPTLFVATSSSSPLPWSAVVIAVVFSALFLIHIKRTPHPLVDVKLIREPLVSSGLAYKAATGLTMSGLGYLISLQLQLDWHYSPLQASVAMLPQVVALLIGGVLVEKFVERVGSRKAAHFGSLSVVAGLLLYGLLGTSSYLPVALSMICSALGVRIVGVIAGLNVMKGVPKTRTSIGAALVDTTDEIFCAIGIAVSGTVLSGLFGGEIANTNWTTAQTAQFETAVGISSGLLTVLATALIVWAFIKMRRQSADSSAD